MGNQLGKSVFKYDESIRIVMLGTAGSGKSATGNTILGKQCFKSDLSLTSLTKHCEKVDGVVDGQKVAVIDTPSLFDTRHTEEKTVKYITQCISNASPGPHIFLIVIKLGRFTEEEKQTVQKIQEIVGEEADKYSMVLFTHGDLLKGKPIEDVLKESEDLQELVAKCNGRYHVFNNEVKNHSQVSKLLKMIKKIKCQNGGGYYTSEMFHKAERAIEEEKQRILKEKEEQNCKKQEELRKEIEEKYEQILREVCPVSSASSSTPPTVYNDELIRIVMVGKTGVGKSATGNTILGQKCFKSEFSPKSLTRHCEKAFGVVDGQKVAVIDTPDLFDTRNTEKETVKDISQCISYASPLPHIFLIVISLGRFTEEEKQSVQKVQKIFGEEANKYSMVLFTHGDLLKGKSIEEFLEDSKDLKEVVDKCHDQYHVFNNEVKDRSQVRKLLKKIQNINVLNGGSYCTTEMFQKAEREIDEGKQRILKEREEQNRKEEEELRKETEGKYERQTSEVCPSFPTFRSTPSMASSNDELIRIVMVGKTGVGKSATGNTILGKQCFKSEFSLTSLTTDCKKDFAEVDGQKVAVIDTPGLFDTRYIEKKTVHDLAHCISFASPGPHIFLVVIRLGRFTEEEKQTVQKIQEIFGEEANKYSMILFTHGDLSKEKTVEELLTDNKELQELLAKYNGQYHVFNNEVKEDRSQVSELLKKIKEINEQNGATYYTTEMFQNAERAIEAEKQRLLTEKEEDIRKEEKELRKKIEDEYHQKSKEVKGDREKEAQLKEECEKETNSRTKKLKEKVEHQTRKLAEENNSVIKLLIKILLRLRLFVSH